MMSLFTLCTIGILCSQLASSFYQIEDYGSPLLLGNVESCLEGVNRPVVVGIGGGSM